MWHEGISQIPEEKTGEEKIVLNGRMKQDFDGFLDHLTQELNPKSIKSFADGLPIIKEEVIKVLEKIFVQKN